VKKKILNLKTPRVIQNKILVEAEYAGHQLCNKFEFPERFFEGFDTSLDRLGKLSEYLAIFTAPYLFDLEYFDIVNVGFSLNAEEITFFEKFIFLGMAEFRYKNNINIRKKPRSSQLLIRQQKKYDPFIMTTWQKMKQYFSTEEEKMLLYRLRSSGALIAAVIVLC